MEDGPDKSQSRGGADVVGFPPLIGLVLIATGLALQLNRPVELVSNYLLALTIGIVVLAAGIGMQIMSVRALKQARTTPLFKKPTTAIVQNGLYGRSRNPIYISVLVQFIGLTFIVNSLWFALILLLLIFYLRFLVIAREERYLERQFDQEYLDYKSKVPRWL